MRSRVPAIAQTGAAERRTMAASPKEHAVKTPSPFDKPLEYATDLKFADMTSTQKCIFAAKLVACIATFGFAFPNVQTD